MKKTVVLIASFLLCGMALVAQNITLEWNRYAPYPSAFYQATLPIDLESEKLHQNDVVSVRIAGVANNDINEFQIAIINEDAPTYWNEMTAFGLVGDVKAGESFEKVVELIVKKGLPHPKIVLSGRNVTLSSTGTAVGSDILGQGGNGGGTSIALTLTKTELTVIPHSERLTLLVENWDGKNQTAAIQNKISKVAVGDVLQVTVSGKSNIDAKELQVVLVDGTPQANYWKELSAWTDFSGAAITANTDFNFSTNVKVTALPTGTGAAALQFYIVAASNSSIMQVENFDLAIKLVEAADATKIQYKKSKK
ncbi:MAG: hypothetical protein LBU90_04355 [Bacteroidales bacterium]|jgi:hypothetical protein|nr:hypothetical protein [Bacteroidales bacterium]